jgi:transporter family-2 protein
MEYIFLFIAFLAGAALPVQVGMNTILAKSADGNAIYSAIVTFVVGLIGLVAYALFRGNPIPMPQTISVSWWAWLGGLCGAFYVASTIVLAPKIGGAALFGLVLAGQMIIALAFDHFGLLGFPQISVSLVRVIGVVLIAGGAIIVAKN